MVRPLKYRRVNQLPGVEIFKPTGIPIRLLKLVNLTIDEFEALRLADYEGLYQEDAALRMGISRQTLGRILLSARKKLVECLVDGAALKIEGGKFDPSLFFLRCEDCNEMIDIDYNKSWPLQCPSCRGYHIFLSCKNVWQKGELG
ncbi:DUF134 domain-containing protein [bacterium]|nr:DUF134 domain-containing protein [bacterium]